MSRLLRVVRGALLITVVLLYTGAPVAHALTAEQKAVYDSGIGYFDLETGSACGDASASDAALTGSDNQQKAFNYFVDAGLSDAQAAAVVGNFVVESSVNPERVEVNASHPELPATSKDPAGLPVVGGWPGGQTRQPGWGLAQWTPSGKIVNIAKDLGITSPIYELSTQLQIILGEMKGTSPTGVKDVYSGIKKITSGDPTEATKYFTHAFEGPLIENGSSRVKAAQKILSEYGSGGGSTGLPAVSGINASCGSSGGAGSVGAVDCSNQSAPTTGAGLSQVRQNVVCLTQGELKLWENGTMKPGGSSPYAFYKYTEGQNQEWCADFVSWIFNQAHYPLGSGSHWRVPAVDSVQAIGEQGDKFEYHSAGSYVPKPGDIVVYKVGMSHVNIVVSVNTNKQNMTVIGGNQGGESTNSLSKVSKYDTGYRGGNGLSGFVSPKN